MRSSFLLLVAACHAAPAAIPGTAPGMDFTRSKGFFTAPVPSDGMSTASWNLRRVDLAVQAQAMLPAQAATSGAVFFSFSAPLDASRLPDLAGSAQPGAQVFLMNAEDGTRTPAWITFRHDGGPFGAPNLLVLLPLQGMPLKPHTLYAAVVLRSLGDADGKPLGVPLQLSQLIAGQQPAGLSGDAYPRALRALQASGVKLSELAGLAAFVTTDPRAELLDYRAKAPPPTLGQPFAAAEVFDEFCVFHATLNLPVFQQGAPPYTSSGGGWTPTLQRFEEANFVVTLPRAPMPAAGFPTAVFIRTGGGGDRPLVDRGPETTHGGPPLQPGTGPALHFARAGFAGVSVDGPLGGLRNPSHADEQFLIFNFQNPLALRDNIRQSALELALLPGVLKTLSFDAGSCGGGVKFDTGKLALMGHSMGATIAPLALYAAPEYRALILSGAGGSWIENVMYKRKPLEVRPLAELILGYADGALTADDPVLTLVQWAAEPADPQVYAAALKDRHILMVQGIVDNYILPRIANGLSLALGLDLAGDELDQEVAGQVPLSLVQPLAGLTKRALPGPANAVVQQREDGLEDGHEVVFQTEPPRHQYRCFLEDFAAGRAPQIRAPGRAASACQ